VSNHDREKAIEAAAKALWDTDPVLREKSPWGTNEGVMREGIRRAGIMVDAYLAALAAPVVQDADRQEAERQAKTIERRITDAAERQRVSQTEPQDVDEREAIRKALQHAVDHPGGEPYGEWMFRAGVEWAERQRVSQDAPTERPRWVGSEHDDGHWEPAGTYTDPATGKVVVPSGLASLLSRAREVIRRGEIRLDADCSPPSPLIREIDAALASPAASPTPEKIARLRTALLDIECEATKPIDSMLSEVRQLRQRGQSMLNIARAALAAARNPEGERDG
jgi:hypothetical protein